MQTTITIPARSLQYYVLAKRWLSDLEFFKIETGFLHRLIDDHRLRLQDNGQIEQLIAAGADLVRLEDLEAGVLLNEQIWQLELMAEDVIAEDAESLAANQVKLEYFMTNLNNEFRLVKHQLYRLLLGEEK